MTRDEVIAMARESIGLELTDDSVSCRSIVSNLLKFAAMVAAAEREACAQINDAFSELTGMMQKSIEESTQRIAELEGALVESRANDRQGMSYLAQVREIVGGADFPDMVSRVKAQASALVKAREPKPGLFCGAVAISTDPRFAGWVFVRHADGINWTTGAKLTPETWGMALAAIDALGQQQTIFGMRVVIDPTMPADRASILQDGAEVVRIENVAALGQPEGEKGGEK